MPLCTERRERGPSPRTSLGGKGQPWAASEAPGVTEKAQPVLSHLLDPQPDGQLPAALRDLLVEGLQLPDPLGLGPARLFQPPLLLQQLRHFLAALPGLVSAGLQLRSQQAAKGRPEG